MQACSGTSNDPDKKSCKIAFKCPRIASKYGIDVPLLNTVKVGFRQVADLT